MQLFFCHFFIIQVLPDLGDTAFFLIIFWLPDNHTATLTQSQMWCADIYLCVSGR